MYQANKGERLSMDETQIVIFITPRVLSGSKTAVRKMGDRVEESFKKQELENLRRQMKKK